MSQTKHIAPRLRNGDSRIRTSAALPPLCKEALRRVAQRRRSSMNWVLEQMTVELLIKEFATFHRPAYKARKNGKDE